MPAVLEDRRQSDISTRIQNSRSATPTSLQIGVAPNIWQRAARQTGIASTAPERIPRLRMRMLAADDNGFAVERVVLEEDPNIGWRMELAADAASADASATAEAEWLRDALALSMAELANLAGRSRKAVYDWFDKTEPSSPQRDAREKLAGIRSVFVGAPKRHLRHVRRLWESKPSAGEALLPLLRQIDSTASLHVEAARAALAALAPALEELAERGQAKPPQNDLGTAQTVDLYHWS